MAGATLSQSIQPTQRAAFCYNAASPVPTSLRNKSSWVTLGRTEAGIAGASEAAAAGAIVALYLNISVYVNVGAFHNYMYSTASGGPALTEYPSGGTIYGQPINWTALTEAQIKAKVGATVRKMKADYPFMNAIFLDDGGPDWTGYNTLSAAVKELFYQAHVWIAEAVRAAANEVGLVVCCNGEWRSDTNHGYPARGTHGCSLYDVFCIEHHNYASEGTFWQAVANGQWRLRDPNGQRCMLIIANSSSDTSAWRNQPNMAWIAQQTTPQYTVAPAPVPTQLTPHDIGLDFGLGSNVTVTVSPGTASVEVGGNTQQFTATASDLGTSFTWSVGSVDGGNATVGTIDATGLYTSPAAQPSGGIVTVRARDAAGNSGSAAVSVTTTTPPVDDLPGAPPAANPLAFGNRFPGTVANNMSPGYIRGCPITPTEDGDARSLVLPVDGGGPGTADQPIRLLFFEQDAAGNGGDFIGYTDEYVIVDGLPWTYVEVDLSALVAAVGNVPMYAMLHSGGTEATGRFARNTSTGVSRGMDAAYSTSSYSPPANLAGAAVGDADLAIYANYTKAAVAGVSLTLPHVGQGIHRLAVAGTGSGVVIPISFIAVKTRNVARLVPEPYFVDSRDDSECEESSPGIFTPKQE